MYGTICVHGKLPNLFWIVARDIIEKGLEMFNLSVYRTGRILFHSFSKELEEVKPSFQEAKYSVLMTRLRMDRFEKKY